MRNKISANSNSAVILTALPVEYQAVRRHLVNVREVNHPEGTAYELGEFKGADGTSWLVGLVQTGMGNSIASLEAERAISFFRSRIAFFVGVAGGIKDVKLGDVVAASKIYGYETGKETDIGFRPRPNVGEPTYLMKHRAIVEERNKTWLNRVIPTCDGDTPKAFVAPIATGEKVVANTKSQTFQQILQNYGDAIAIEMEGRGFLEATHANHSVHALVVRGISDLIDAKAEADKNGSQEIASKHAAAFAFEVLANWKVPSSSRRNWLLLFFAIFLISAGLVTSYYSKPPVPEKLSFGGIVIDDETRIPLANVAVSLEDVQSAAGTNLEAVTNEQGNYRFEPIPGPPKKVRVRATKPGYDDSLTTSTLGADYAITLRPTSGAKPP